MKIETYIDSLVSYAMNTGLAQPEDHQVLINRILELLQKDEFRTIQEVCEQVGYTNPTSFAKAFSKVYGVSPTAYRRDFSTLKRG